MNLKLMGDHFKMAKIPNGLHWIRMIVSIKKDDDEARKKRKNLDTQCCSKFQKLSIHHLLDTCFQPFFNSNQTQNKTKQKIPMMHCIITKVVMPIRPMVY